MGSLTTGPAWYLMRGSGVVALVLLTAVTVLGIATSKHAHLRGLPRFATLALHRSVSLLSVVFLGIHIVTAVIDPYAAVRLVQIVLPVASGRYPVWLGAGALSLDVVGAVLATSLLRRRLGRGVWKGVHWLAYASWPLAFAHGIGMGTDASSAWFLGVALTCLAAVVLAAAWRLAGDPGALPKHLGAPLGPVARSEA